jgi:hypothetical protein
VINKNLYTDSGASFSMSLQFSSANNRQYETDRSMYKFLSVYIKMHRIEIQQSSTGLFFMEFKLCLMDFKTLRCWYFLSVPKTRLMLKFLNLLLSPRPKFQFYLERNAFFQHIRLQISWGRLVSNSYE